MKIYVYFEEFTESESEAEAVVRDVFYDLLVNIKAITKEIAGGERESLEEKAYSEMVLLLALISRQIMWEGHQLYNHRVFHMVVLDAYLFHRRSDNGVQQLCASSTRERTEPEMHLHEMHQKLSCECSSTFTR
ncbi:hypothetical protein Tco_0807713 [Tanacetum coccineum]